MEREAFKKKFDAADTTFYKTWVENVVSECGKANRALQNEDAILVCDSNGNTATLEMPLGTYYAKETAVGKGYLINFAILCIVFIFSYIGNSYTILIV